MAAGRGTGRGGGTALRNGHLGGFKGGCLLACIVVYVPLPGCAHLQEEAQRLGYHKFGLARLAKQVRGRHYQCKSLPSTGMPLHRVFTKGLRKFQSLLGPHFNHGAHPLSP